MILWEGYDVYKYSWPCMVLDSHIHRFNQLLITTIQKKKKKKNVSKKQNLNALHITYIVLDTIIRNLDKQWGPTVQPRNQTWVSCIVGGFFTICTHETQGNVFNNPW